MHEIHTRSSVTQCSARCGAPGWKLEYYVLPPALQAMQLVHASSTRVKHEYILAVDSSNSSGSCQHNAARSSDRGFRMRHAYTTAPSITD
eukprot:2641-Heterococcus_DN1.PRE.3